jgi:hypothetical protein
MAGASRWGYPIRRNNKRSPEAETKVVETDPDRAALPQLAAGGRESLGTLLECKEIQFRKLPPCIHTQATVPSSSSRRTALQISSQTASNPLEPGGYSTNHLKKLYILPTQCTYVFLMVLTLHNDYFSRQP